MRAKVKIICTIGPASFNEGVLRKFEARKVSLVRINLSHVSVGGIEGYIHFLKKFTESQTLPISSHSIGIKIGNQKLIKVETPLYFGRKWKRVIRNVLEKIQIPSLQFYNLESDPAEKNNLAKQKKEEVSCFLGKYNQVLKRVKGKDHKGKEIVDEEVKKHLRDLVS